MDNLLNFRVSSALKDIIGRDLITDDFIAVFELVKNSFDAYASRVDIYFNNIHSDNAEILIVDNGKGMNYDDLTNKWLFVAYSAKNDGTEDENFDYRDRIYTNRPFAGAKGIGRFSCDRLGRRLELETIKQEENPQVHVLITNWEKFEANLKEEFINVDVEHKVITTSTYNIVHGTALKINDLRSDWDRNKFLKLKDSLSKLINPNRGKGEHQFKIFLHVPEELIDDISQEDDFKKVNGEIKNFIFDTLGLKTTKIHASISENGEHVTTELSDGGTLIYKIVELNSYSFLKDIDYTIYYLNRSAKVTFTRKMGLPVSKYGNIFLYKNGFRIYPFGEPGEDPLKIDVRKSQGYNRYLGTRELIGQIEIFGNNTELRETSSRGDGLIKTKTYEDLENYFWEVLRRLERYVVDVQQWGLSIEEQETLVNKNLATFISKLTDSDKIIDFQIGDNLINTLDAIQAGSSESFLKEVRQIAIKDNNLFLADRIEKIGDNLSALKAAKFQAEEEARRERKLLKTKTQEFEQTQTENLFLKSLKSQDLNEVVSFMHSIGISASTIDNYLGSTYQKINRGIEIDPKALQKIIEVVSFENRKILSITRFATKANFKVFAEESTIDMVEFLSEYAVNIVAPLRSEDITFHIEKNSNIKYVRTFKPIELSILFDNLVSNSIRAKAKNAYITFSETPSDFTFSFRDDGIGVSDENLKKIFDFGYTTTSGSGLGLFHVSEIIKNLNGEVSVNNKLPKGLEFNFKLIKNG